ncbi:DUF262 domain-containing protein [Aggregicoccus sp. 17bor-14]|nr:DUF262 domain-containing protein [Aggregicoccus sp. 17bor-14]
MSAEERERTVSGPRQECFDDAPTDTEVEDVGPGVPERKALDAGKLRIVPKPLSVRQALDLVDAGDIALAQDFPRLALWTSRQRSLLVESVLVGIPLPALYFHQDTQGTLHVVDGVQRLTVLHRFAKGLEPLTELEYFPELSGKTFDTLDTQFRRRFQGAQLAIHVLEPSTPDEVKFDVFRRINTGGSPLTAQEIRHLMGRSGSRELLTRLTALPSFAEATGGAFQNERRMTDRELALRFCAFRVAFDEYLPFPGLDAFLLDFTRRLDGTHPQKPALTDAEREGLVSDFDRAMRSATAVFGASAFRKYPPAATKPGPLNRALFESWAVALADHAPEALAPRSAEISAAARALLEDPAYSDAVSVSTGDALRVALRFTRAREILQRETP